jgi:hypothetical protein
MGQSVSIKKYAKKGQDFKDIVKIEDIFCKINHYGIVGNYMIIDEYQILEFEKIDEYYKVLKYHNLKNTVGVFDFSLFENDLLGINFEKNYTSDTVEYIGNMPMGELKLILPKKGQTNKKLIKLVLKKSKHKLAVTNITDKIWKRFVIARSKEKLNIKTVSVMRSQESKCVIDKSIQIDCTQPYFMINEKNELEMVFFNSDVRQIYIVKNDLIIEKIFRELIIEAFDSCFNKHCI